MTAVGRFSMMAYLAETHAVISVFGVQGSIASKIGYYVNLYR